MTPRPRIPISDGGCILFGGCPGLTPLLLPEPDEEDGIPIRGAGAMGRAPLGGCCPDIGGSRLAPNVLVPGAAGALFVGGTAMSLARTTGGVPAEDEVVAGPGEGAASSALVIFS